MVTTTELVTWPNTLAETLEADMHWSQGEGYWEADRPELKPTVHARATSALDFLERFAGSDSQWSIRAQQMFDSHGHHQSMESGARALADILRAWIAQVDNGIVAPRNIEAQSARAVASMDLMEQVRVLVDDKPIHPAAPVVLAGAALEVALRSAIDQLDLKLTERPDHCRRQAAPYGACIVGSRRQGR
jgi:hypothetical protein